MTTTTADGEVGRAVTPVGETAWKGSCAKGVVAGMRALGIDDFGQELRVLDVPEPHAGPGEVRVRVHAVAVNPTDTGVVSGRYRGRHAEHGPYIPGADAAGVIDQVGDGSRWSVGDRVALVVVPYREAGGSYADYVVVPETSVLRLPDDVDFAHGTVFLMNALTARLLLDDLGLSAGQTLAVTGAAGALGQYAVQMAEADGLRVIADAAEKDDALVRSFGPDEVVRRGDDVAQRIREVVPEGVDGLIDGSVQGEQTIAAVKDGGTIESVRGWSGDLERGITAQAILVYQHVDADELIRGLERQLADGVYALRVADVLPVEQAVQAHLRLAAGGVRGRLVLDFS